MEWFLHFLRKIGKKLTYFTSAMVFDDGHILDDDLREVLVQNATEKARIALLSDCCHSGSVKDLQSKRLNGQKKGPPNVMPMPSTQDSQTAKQMTVDIISQEIFSLVPWQVYRANLKISAKDLAKYINKSMARFNQSMMPFSSSMFMTRKPFLSP
jgi:hypothetical protein